MIEADNSNIEGGFMSLNLMLRKNSLLFVFVKPKLYCFNQSYALQVSFFSLITHVVVTSSFGCVRNFVLIKLQLPMFLKVTSTRPLLRLSPEPYACRSAQACCSMPIGQMPKEIIEDSDISSTVCASLLFSAVCFLIIYSLFGR